MKQFEYEAVQLKYSIWTGKAKFDYLEIINERGRAGWRFVGFAPTFARSKGVKYPEMIFERELDGSYTDHNDFR